MSEGQGDIGTSPQIGDANVNEGGAGAGGNAPAQEPKGGAPQPEGQGTQDWRSLLSEEWRDDPALKDFKSLDSLAKSFKDTQRMVGSQPKPPDDPSKYELPDDETGKLFKDLAHKNGLTVDQAKGLYEELTQVESSREQEFNQALQKEQEEHEKALKGEWGDKYDDNIKAAHDAAEKLFPEDLRKALNVTGLDKHPGLMKHLLEVNKAMSEGTMYQSAGGGFEPQDENTLREKLREHNKSNADVLKRNNPLDPDYVRAMEDQQKLISQIAKAKLARDKQATESA